MKNALPLSLLVVFLSPFSASAQIAVTEIMYDLETGSDIGREWIEVRNTWTSDVDLGLWRLFEAETNHRIEATEEGGATLLGNGEYAVIADNPAKFRIDWPSYSGILFDSAFSLSNTGETLILRLPAQAGDGELIDKDTVTYNATWGADGDGKSLQLVDGEWVSAAPTPGEENETAAQAEPPVASGVEPPPSGSAPLPALSLFTARISEKEKFAIVGAPTKFTGETVGTTEGLSGKTRFLWNFGDGGTGEGESVLHAYKYPGEYVVILNAVSGAHSPEDRATIKAIPSELSISNIGIAGDFFIELSNNSAYELNLSGWLLKSGARYFVIPENSFILPKKKIVFSQETTNLLYSIGDIIGLLYPNGLTAAVFSAVSMAEGVSSAADKKTESAPATVKTTDSLKKSGEAGKPELSLRYKDEKTLSAAVALRPANDEKTESWDIPWPWLLGTFALVVLGITGAIAARRTKTPGDDFTISEEENDTV